MGFNQKVTAEMVTSVLVEEVVEVELEQDVQPGDLETTRCKLQELSNDVVFIRTELNMSVWELDNNVVNVVYTSSKRVEISGIEVSKVFICELENELCKAEIAAAREEEETPAPTLTSAHLELFKMFGVPQAELYKVTDDIELDDNTILEAGTIVEWAEHPMQHDDFVSVRLPNGRIEWVFHTSLKKANF